LTEVSISLCMTCVDDAARDGRVMCLLNEDAATVAPVGSFLRSPTVLHFESTNLSQTAVNIPDFDGASSTLAINYWIIRRCICGLLRGSTHETNGLVDDDLF